MKTVPNENILKLRQITDEMVRENFSDKYKQIVLRLKSIMDDGKNTIEKTNSSKNKIKCYEDMCVKVTNILSNVK